MLGIDAKNREIQGHRGSRGTMPGKDSPAFLAAIEAGADRLELDLQVTQDGEIVIYHDFFINKELCVPLDGTPVVLPTPLIHSLTLSQVKQWDCGTKTNPLFPRQRSIPGTQVPTLIELLKMISESSLLHAKKVLLNLEIKGDPHRRWIAILQ